MLLDDPTVWELHRILTEPRRVGTGVPSIDHVCPDALDRAARTVKAAPDVDFGEVPGFNSAPCAAHEDTGGPVTGCLDCGVTLRRHQRVGAAWAFLRRDCLIADGTGSGKTAQVAMLIALMSAAGELDRSHGGGRVVVVCRSAAVRQWRSELNRMLPTVAVATADGTRAERSRVYAEPWDALVIGEKMLLPDYRVIEEFPVRLLVGDDVDPLRHAGTKTAARFKRLAHRSARTVIANATPLQKKLDELYDVLSVVGGRGVLGSREGFERRFVVKRPTYVYDPRNHRRRRVTKTTGYRRVSEFRGLIEPLVIRRTPGDLDDVSMPSVCPENVHLDLTRGQADRYADLADGVVRLVRESGSGMKHVTALTKVLYGAKITESTAALDGVPGGSESGDSDASDDSAKFDWVCDKLDGDWAPDEEAGVPGEKVVVFCQFVDSVTALSRRLSRAGVGHECFYGFDGSKTRRARALELFRTDPDRRVLIGTSAIEASLNLQVARHLVCCSQILNAKRMEQLAGRIQREGSAYATVYVHNLLANGTQDAEVMRMLEIEAALSDAVWDEESDLFRSLSPLQLAQLIVPDVDSRARSGRGSRSRSGSRSHSRSGG